MCLEVRKTCNCGRESVQFHLRDNVMTQEVLLELYCPECAHKVEVKDDSMVRDNGWVIEYDMDLARFMAVSKLMVDAEEVTPAYVFDTGYAAWREMYPGEQEDVLRERKEIMELLQKDQAKYLQAINQWNIDRVEKLKADGWRKAMAA
jgi:hypothetical protein